MLCHSPLVVDKKVYKDTIIDIDDKITAKVKTYSKESIIEYEMMSRDNRIGENTNAATSILNQYTTDAKWIKENEDNISLLRIYQGKEIDYQKTGVRWQMSKKLRRYVHKTPYFLLYNYPNKLKRYNKIKNKNKSIEKESNKIPLNAYHSPSPMNELCDYINTWEKKKIVWDNSCVNTSSLIINNDLRLDDAKLIKNIRHYITEFAVKYREEIEKKEKGDKTNIDAVVEYYKNRLEELLPNDHVLLANYVIKTSYLNMSISKVLAWSIYGDTIIQNLRKNSPASKQCKIIEIPYKTEHSYEYLGKYYEMVYGLDN